MVAEAYGNAKGTLGGIKVKNVKTGAQGWGGAGRRLRRMLAEPGDGARACMHAARQADLRRQRRCHRAGEITDVPLAGLFFAIGHEPATAFLSGQVRAQ